MFTFKIAQTEKEKAEVLALLQASYAQVHTGSDYRTSISTPFFEQIAVDSILLRYEHQLVGTVSLMQNKTGGLLPSEYLFNLERSSLWATNTTEVGRLAKTMDPTLPKEIENAIFPVLLWLTALRLTERKIESYICSVQHYLARKFVQIGFEPTEIQPTSKTELPAAFGSYAKGNIKFLYCKSATSYQALERLNLDLYLIEDTKPVSMLTTPILTAA